MITSRSDPIFTSAEHPWAKHDNVQIRLHPFPQSIHGPSMITSRSDYLLEACLEAEAALRAENTGFSNFAEDDRQCSLGHTRLRREPGYWTVLKALALYRRTVCMSWAMAPQTFSALQRTRTGSKCECLASKTCAKQRLAQQTALHKRLDVSKTQAAAHL